MEDMPIRTVDLFNNFDVFACASIMEWERNHVDVVSEGEGNNVSADIKVEFEEEVEKDNIYNVVIKEKTENQDDNGFQRKTIEYCLWSEKAESALLVELLERFSRQCRWWEQEKILCHYVYICP